MMWTVTDNNGNTGEPLDTYDLITGGDGFDFHNAEEIERLFPIAAGEQVLFEDNFGTFTIRRIS